MRDLTKQRRAVERELARAAEKVRNQSRLIESMHRADPRRSEASVLLVQMRQTLASAQINRAMFDYVAEVEGGPRQVPAASSGDLDLSAPVAAHDRRI